MKARVGSVGQLVTSHYPAGRSPFPSVAGSTMGESVASWSVYLMLIFTKTDASNVADSGDVLQEACCSKQGDTRLVERHAVSEKPVTDC